MIVIKGPLPTLNQVTNANRSHKMAGSSQKKKATARCKRYVQKAMTEGFRLKHEPADLKLTWFVKNKRKDPDNISSAVKFVLDGMVEAGLIENDGWKQIGNLHHYFKVDKDERVEIEELKG